jgi:hypothetical protein
MSAIGQWRTLGGIGSSLVMFDFPNEKCRGPEFVGRGGAPRLAGCRRRS